MLPDIEIVGPSLVVLDGHGVGFQHNACDVTRPRNFVGFFIVEVDLQTSLVKQLKTQLNNAVVEWIDVTSGNAVVGRFSLGD